MPAVSTHTRRAFRPHRAAWLALLLGLLAPTGAIAQDTTQTLTPAGKALEAGRRRYEQAFYDLAARSFEKAASAAPVESAVGAARCLIELGHPAQAIERLDQAIQAAKDHPAWHAVRGQALADTGEYAVAIAAFRAALKLSDAELDARVRCGELLSYLGRQPEAIELLAPLASIEAVDFRDDPAWRVSLSHGRLLLAELRPPADADAETAFVLRRILQPAIDGKHRARWMARLAAADLFADKHNRDEARADYQAVLKLRPRVAAAHVGLARLAYDQNDYSAARTHLLAALSHNPNQAGGLRLFAKVRLAQSDAPAAMALLEKRLTINPNDLEALALAAVAARTSGHSEAAREFIARADAVNPRSGLVQFTLGMSLAAARQLERAERRLIKATEYAPHRPAYQVELANLWLLRGEEKRAIAALKKARAADPYDARSVNLLNMLYELEAMERIESEHFTLRYEADDDRLVGLAVPAVLEECYSDITAIFSGYVAKRKTLVEIFPRKSQFAVRISGKPWIGTVGASSGPVIAMVSPRKDATGIFGWAVVLRHEFVHTVTIALSGGRVPRWMTEGLAQHYSGEPLSWSMAEVVAEKLRLGKLRPVAEIDRAFSDNEDPNGVTQGYGQGRLMVDFLMAEWGDEIMDKFLAGYAREEDGRSAFESTLGTTIDEFDRRFAVWCTKQVASWGFSTVAYPSRDALKKRIEANAKDAAASGILARLEFIAHDFKAARREADHALAIDDQQPDALLVRARLPIVNEQPVADDVRLRQLEDLFYEVEPLLTSRPGDPQALWALARLARESQQPERAAAIALKLTHIAPGCEPAQRLLAEVYEEVGDSESAYPFLVQWARRSTDDATPALRLAELFEARDQPERALPWAERVLRIDMFDVQNYKRLGRLLVASELWTEALEPLKLFCELSPEDEAVWADLADAYARLGRNNEATEAAERAISLDADSRAQQILLRLQEGEP